MLFSSYVDDIAFIKILCKQRWIVMHCIEDGVVVLRSPLRRCCVFIIIDLVFLVC